MSSNTRLRGTSRGMRAAVKAALLASVAAACVVLTGCSYFFKERPTGPKPIEIGAAEETKACLADSVDVLARYFRKEAGANKADEIVDCAIRSMDLFAKNVNGEQADRYTRQELQGFVEKYFLNDSPIDPQLMPLLFRIKSTLFGGDDETLTREEFTRIREFIDSFKEVARRLEPYADIYGLNANLASRDPNELARFEKAIEEFVAVVRDLSKPFQSNSRPSIELSDLEELMGMMSKTERAAPFIRLAGAAKQILVSPPADKVRSQDWAMLFSGAARLYTFWLRYTYLLKDSSILWGPDLKQTEAIIRQTLDLLDQGIAFRGAGSQIAPVEWEKLIDEVDRLGFLPKPLRASSLKNLVWPLSARLFRDPSKAAPARGSVTGLGGDELRRLRSDVENWLLGHRMSVLVAADDGLYRVERLIQEFSDRAIEEKTPSPAGPEVRSAARMQILGLLKEGRILSWDEQDRLAIVRREDSQGMKRRDLILMNAIRAAASVVLRGYSQDSQRAQSGRGITEDETQEFYLDMRPIGVDLDLMDTRVVTAGARSFMEANIFTSRADGDDFVSLPEAVEFFHYILSGGRAAHKIQQTAERECGAGAKDITGQIRLGIACFRTHLRENFERYFGNLPGMVRYTQGFMNQDVLWNEFLDILENASRPSGISQRSIESTDLKTLATIVHYTESLFVNFDNNRSEHFETDEIWSAFPRFKNFIRQMAKGQAESESMQKTIFSYLLWFGRPPEMTIAGKVHLGTWYVRRHWHMEQADRMAAMKIIASLASFSRAERLSKVEEFFKKYQAYLAQAFGEGHLGAAREFAKVFQCPPEAVDPLRNFLRARGAEFMAPPSLDEIRKENCRVDTKSKACLEPTPGAALTPRQFAERANEGLIQHPELSKVCLPVM